MKKILVFCLVAGLVFSISACGRKGNGDVQTEELVIDNKLTEDVDTNLLCEIYKEAYSKNENTSERVKKILEEAKGAGYVAVDTENQINMTNHDKMLKFISCRDNMEDAQIQVVRVTYLDGFFLYVLKTTEGKVYVEQSYFRFENNQLNENEKSKFEADPFTYTEEGYVILAGSWYSDETFVLTMAEDEEHIAMRVTPLDEECRMLCSKYLTNVSYALNNMFITDWKQDDFGALEFYDVFDKFYSDTYGIDSPYVMNENLSIGNEYSIAADEFEIVITEHIPVSAQELKEKLRYNYESNCYIYRPRGFRENDYGDRPYPEVVSYSNNEDGSITLQVNAVCAHQNTSRLFAHEVKVMEKNGKPYYLSNVITMAQEIQFRWHADRFTDDEWNDFYKQ